MIFHFRGCSRANGHSANGGEVKLKVNSASRSSFKVGDIYFFAYGIYLAFSILNTSFYAKYILDFYGIALWFCFAILAFREVLVLRFTPYDLLKLIFAIFITVYMYIVGSGSFSAIFIFLYCGRNIEFKKIAKFTVYISSAVVSFVIISSYCGIIQNYISTHVGNVRQYLGFRYGLYPPCYLFNITALAIYIHKFKIKWSYLITLLLLNYGMFLLTDARVSFYLSIALLIAVMILKIRNDTLACKKVLCGFLSLSYIAVAAFSIFATVNYSRLAWLNDLNEKVGGRLALGLTSIMTYGVSLFGNKNITWIGQGLDPMGNRLAGTYLYVDNLYLHILQKYGIVFFIIYILLFTLVLFRCVKAKEYHLFLILVTLAFRGFIDDLSIQLFYNTFWLVIGQMVFKTTHGRVGAARRILKGNRRRLSETSS